MKRTSRRIPTLLLAAAMMLTLFPVTALAASGTITENGTYNLSAYGAEGIITINPGLTVTLEGSTDTTYFYTQIDCGAGVNLTLNNMNINNSTVSGACALSFTGAGNTLTLVGENTLRSGSTQPGVKVEGSTELTIQGDGSLTATGGGTTSLNGAGIGGGNGGIGGKITINSGRVTAAGGRGGAGIGGGARGNGGTFIINGGTVTATGGQYGAGIGGGYGYAVGSGNGGTTTINDGTVVATGGDSGAGIGGGCYDSGGAVTITGGSVRATGTGGGKDIGGGAGATNHGTLKNEDGDGVYLTPIQLLGGGASNAAVSSLTTNLTGYSYGLEDVFSDSSGWLYFYLPVGTATTGVFTPAGIFTGYAITADSPTTFYFAAGDAGEIELQKGMGADGEMWVQWRYVGDIEWQDLIAVSDITGSDGEDGATGNGIASIAKTGSAGNVDTYTVTFTDGTSTTFTVTNGTDGEDGATGATGNGIASIAKTSSVGKVDTYIITFTDGTSTTFTVTNGTDGTDGADGADGNGIASIAKTSSAGNVDTYTITFTGGTSTTFTVTNGTDGEDGNGIVGITKTSSAGNVDTYTITFTDGTSTTFTVTNGADGKDGKDGADGRDIELRVDDGYIQWRYTSGADTVWKNLMAVSVVTGPQGPQGAQGTAGADGSDSHDGSDGADGRDGADGANGRNGEDGKDGNGISSITKTATDGNVDTYTISFTDGTSTTFTVINGKDGVGVASAMFNESGELVFTLTDGTQINLGLIPGGLDPTFGVVSEDKSGSGAAIPIALGAVALSSQLWWLLPLLRRKLIKR